MEKMQLPHARNYQEEFKNNYKEEIGARKITPIESRVADLQGKADYVIDLIGKTESMIRSVCPESEVEREPEQSQAPSCELDAKLALLEFKLIDAARLLESMHSRIKL